MKIKTDDARPADVTLRGEETGVWLLRPLTSKMRETQDTSQIQNTQGVRKHVFQINLHENG